MLPKAQVVENTFIPKNVANESYVAQEGGNLTPRRIMQCYTQCSLTTSRPHLSIAIVDLLAT